MTRLFEEFIEEAELTTASRNEVIASLRKVIRAGVASVRESERTVSFATAVAESLESRKERRPSTLADLRSFTNRMLRYKDWENKPLRSFTGEQCREMIKAVFSHSGHVYRKALSTLHSIFAYGQKRGWCDNNPTETIERPPVNEQRIEILTTKQIKALVSASKTPEFEPMCAPISLMLWCGIRPGEVQRLKWRDIDTKEGVVYIDPTHSKTGGARAVPLRGEARLLCAGLGKNANDLVAPRNWVRLWQRVRNRAGLRHWQQDALRHTFASLHMKYFHNPPQLQEEMGHRDCRLLRTRYLNMRNLSAQTARKFFQCSKPCRT